MSQFFSNIWDKLAFWWEDFSQEFYQNFLYNDRWLQLLDGL